MPYRMPSVKGNNMFHILNHVENDLGSLLQQEDKWASVYVDYHLPYVQRLWTKVNYDGIDYRVYLHRILPCELDQCLFHPHPWPSIMKILSGQYKMQVGFGEGLSEPPVSTTLILPAGTIYEMTNPDSWHAVCPIDISSFSLMISGTPWDRMAHKSTKKLIPLANEQKAEIFEFFRFHYS